MGGLPTPAQTLVKLWSNALGDRAGARTATSRPGEPSTSLTSLTSLTRLTILTTALAPCSTKNSIPTRAAGRLRREGHPPKADIRESDDRLTSLTVI